MPTKNEIIRSTYKKYLGSKAQTLDRIQQMDKKKSEEDEDYEPTGITKKDVDSWFKNNDQLAPALESPPTKPGLIPSLPRVQNTPSKLICLTSSMSKATRTLK